MKNAKPLEIAIISAAFLALFPGFFFYNSALATGLIGPFLGGFFSAASLLFLPFLAWIYFRKLRQDARFFTAVDFAFFAFLTYFFFVVAFNYANGSDYELARAHCLDILQYFVVFVIFRLAEFKSRRMMWIEAACLAGMTVIIFSLSVDGHFNLQETGEFGYSESVSTYQGFARSYLVTFLVLVPFVKQRPLRLCMYAVCLPALFVNSARSEFVALAALVILPEILYSRYWWLALSLVLGVVALFSSYWGEFKQLLPENRTLELLDLSHSTSWEGRGILTDRAFETIAAHPLLGDYGSYAGKDIGIGSAAHNILSAWVDLGLIGFVYLLFMLGIPACSLFMKFISRRADKNPEETVLTFNVLFITLLLLFTAKDFTYALVPAAMGRYAYLWHANIWRARTSMRLA